MSWYKIIDSYHQMECSMDNVTHEVLSNAFQQGNMCYLQATLCIFWMEVPDLLSL